MLSCDLKMLIFWLDNPQLPVQSPVCASSPRTGRLVAGALHVGAAIGDAIGTIWSGHRGRTMSCRQPNASRPLGQSSDSVFFPGLVGVPCLGGDWRGSGWWLVRLPAPWAKGQIKLLGLRLEMPKVPRRPIGFRPGPASKRTISCMAMALALACGGYLAGFCQWSFGYASVLWWTIDDTTSVPKNATMAAYQLKYFTSSK
jgi:hypothetical protein